MAVTVGRAAALEVLRAVERGRRLDLAFSAEAGQLEERNRRWVHEAVYGICRLRGRLDHLLARHLHDDIENLQAPLLCVLRLGAYQLLHMTSVPPYAAVSQAVDLARSLRGGRRTAPLVNAVLRKLAEEGENAEFFPDPALDPAGFLSTWGSHPRWLIDRWLLRWSYDEVRRLVDAGNQPPPLTLLPLSLSVEEAVARLARAGIASRAVGSGSSAVEVTDGSPPIRALNALAAVVQDPGAALVAVYADPPLTALALDLCAAPGGKTLALRRRASYVLAVDRSLPRLRLLKANLARTGLSAGLVQALAERPPVREAGFVLLDAPCTGTGTFRRHPDARWRLAPSDPAKMAAVQERMLQGAASVVPKGGILVYSTCTLEPEENEEQVDRFLQRHGQFRLEISGSVAPKYLQGQRLVVLPQRTGFDAAFAARLVRSA